MDENYLSSILRELLTYGKALKGGADPRLTAERLVVAFIDRMNKRAALVWPELIQTRTMLKSALRSDSRDKLMAYICRQEHISETELDRDARYLVEKVELAEKQSREQHLSSLSTAFLLRLILRDPTPALQEALDMGKVVLEEKKQPTQPTQPIPLEQPPAEEGQAASETETPEGVDPGTAALQEAVTKAAEERAAARAAQSNKSADTALSPQMVNKKTMAGLVEQVKTLGRRLSDAVFGQDHAVNTFLTGYFQASLLSMIDKTRKQPKATFLFAGPPGVGKTFLAETVAQALELPFKRFDMSEYSDREAGQEFCGSDKVYKNSKAGNVTSFVAENPECVLLFDEIEKAHTNVIHLFLQMLDAGRLRDSFTNQEVSFKDTIIILTTNAGRQLYEDSESGDYSTVSRKVIVSALQKDINPATGVPYFPAAICSRFASGNVVMFNHMGAHHLRDIACKEIQRHAANLKRETGIQCDFDEQVYTALLFAEGASADARTVRSRAESFFNDELYELLRLLGSDKVETPITNLQSVRVEVDLSDAKPDIVALFQSESKPKMLVFSDEESVKDCASMLDSVEVVGCQSYDTTVDWLKKEEFGFVLLDMYYGVPAGERSSLNIADVVSPARDVYKFLREQRADVPLYLVETAAGTLSEEEETSFLRQGVRGVLRPSTNPQGFVKTVGVIADNLHQQASMVKLSAANKLVAFETAQSILYGGQTARIRLFDFDMAVAVDSEDSKNVLSAVSKPQVRFAEVIGARDAKKELAYFIEYLKNPKKYMGTGVKAPKGVLLYGPPGTGKTLLAKAMACESDVTFIAAEGNQFLKSLVGEGPQAVHQLFRTARKYAPAILFIDEIDAIAKERRGSGSNNVGTEEVLTAFLTEMDGFVNDPSKPVFVLAATNFDVEPGRARSLDPALMRRFDRRVYIELPDREDRTTFLTMKVNKNPALDVTDQQVDSLAMRSAGMSLAQLDSVVELALRSAIRAGSTKVTDAILLEAFETFNGGEKKAWDVSQLERIARHEAGHALLCYHSGETPAYLTIVSRGNVGGYMQHADQEDKALYTREELLSCIRTALGGRAAEMVYYGEQAGVSTTASGDLSTATELAQQIVCSYGMDATFGLAVQRTDAPMSTSVLKAVNDILSQQLERALTIITANRDKMDALVQTLMDKNHLTGDEIVAVLGTVCT